MTNKETKQESKKETIFFLRGLTKKDFGVLKTFWDKDTDNKPSVHYSVWASSQKALPSNQEMNDIGKIAPCIFFPPGGFPGLAQSFDESEFNIDFIDKKLRSLIFLDEKIIRLKYHGGLVEIKGILTQVIIKDGLIDTIIHHLDTLLTELVIAE